MLGTLKGCYTMLLKNSSHHCWCEKLMLLTLSSIISEVAVENVVFHILMPLLWIFFRSLRNAPRFPQIEKTIYCSSIKNEKKMDINFLLTWKGDRLPCNLLNVFSSSTTIPIVIDLQTCFIYAGYVLWDAYLNRTTRRVQTLYEVAKFRSRGTMSYVTKCFPNTYHV